MSFRILGEYHIAPEIKDYDLVECGVFEDVDSAENQIEKIISSRNSDADAQISVGDVFRIFRAGKLTPFFVDAVVISKLPCF